MHGYKANDTFVREILEALYFQIFLPEKSIIAFKEDVIEMSFILKGDVIVFDKGSNIEIIKLTEGSYFGDI